MEARNFIDDIIEEDRAHGRFSGEFRTRFPPEPNGYLHIGHAKSIVLNASLARRYGGRFHLRFDDTNPVTEEQSFVSAIIDDVRWLGADFGEHLYYASDYFSRMYELAEKLVRDGQAFVCELSAEQMREYRGTLTAPGRDSPWRNRPAEENLQLLRQMRSGAFPAGSRTLRAKIDNASGNLNLRDPVMYRIVDAAHHRQGRAWHIYPSYDWAHGLEDSFEGITYSVCTLEFENHRPLYDWFLKAAGVHHPRQVEFAKLNLTNTVLSKRNLRHLVENKHVSGWDDPRMPTIAGMRRRGYPPEAIWKFCEEVGVTKLESVIELARLEHTVRDHLNAHAPRRLGVLRPLKLIITNYPEGTSEEVELQNHPESPALGTRTLRFGRELYIEREDFEESPPKDYYRLRPGGEVRLRGAYLVRCVGVRRGADGTIEAVECEYDPATRGGMAPDGRKVRGTIHWIAAATARRAEVRLFERLFTAEHPGEGHEGDFPFLADLNPHSLDICREALIEPSLAAAAKGERCQLERLGYFCVDAQSTAEVPVLNRIITLKDSFQKGAKTHKPMTTPKPPEPQAAAPKPAAPPAAPTVGPPAEIGIEDFAKVSLRAGRLLAVEPMPGSEKLLKLSVDLGEESPRTILSGIAKHFTPAELLGRRVTIVANLKPRRMMGLLSQGMLLTAQTSSGGLSIVDPGEVPPGSPLG